MPRFLIEVPHEEEAVACVRAAQVLLRTGSHFLTHAEFGCKDGDHHAWIFVEGSSKSDVRNMLPVPYRASARIVELSRFSLEELETLTDQHRGSSNA